MSETLLDKILSSAMLALFFLRMLFLYIRGKSSLSWTACNAEVLDVGVDLKKDDDTGDKYEAFIKYQYAYLDELYRGDNIKYGSTTSSNLEDAEAFVNGICRGDEVTIYVNPNCPHISVLNQGYEDNTIWLLLLLVLIPLPWVIL